MSKFLAMTVFGAIGALVSVVKPVYAGKALAKVSATGDTVVATIRPNVFEPIAPEAGKSAPVETLDIGTPDIRTVIKEVLAKASEKLDLTEADVIVAGGRGLKDAANWHLIEELAAATAGARSLPVTEAARSTSFGVDAVTACITAGVKPSIVNVPNASESATNTRAAPSAATSSARPATPAPTITASTPPPSETARRCA